MKILQVIPTLGKGGAERLVLNIVSALQHTEGVEVKLITFTNENAYPFLTETIDWEVVPCRVIPSVKGKNSIEIEGYKQLIDAFEPDIVHSHLFEAEMVTREYVLPKAKYFTHFHDNMRQLQKVHWQGSLKNFIIQWYERSWMLKRYLRCNNQFITIAKDGFQYAKQNLPDKLGNKVHLLPNATEISRFSRNEERADYVTPNIWRFITIGSLVKKKGYDFLLEVAKELVKREVSFRWEMVGSGNEHNKLNAFILKNNLGNYVKLVGHLNYPEKALANSHVYLHGAYEEPFGLVLIEAMAAGLPVISTDGGGNRDLIQEGENGFLIQKRDAKPFTAKIVELLENHELRKQMAKAAEQFSLQYDIKPYVQKLLQVYKG